MIEQFPARLHVLLARDAKVGLIIRRGPSKQTATFLWDRKRDTVTLGQWLKGRIYERRSDLSPDGKHLIYFAMNGYWKSESKGSWTAVSRAPYLKALAFYPKGDCWNGGGLWTTQSTYWLNEGYIEHETGHESPVIKRDDQFCPQEHDGAECTGVYYLRLIRDGWRHLGKEDGADIFEKYVSKGWTLRKIAHAQVNHPPGKGCYWDEHALIHDSAKQTCAYPDWEWADIDGKRLAWTTQGKLFTATLSESGPQNQTMVEDFNPMSFQAIQAPY